MNSAKSDTLPPIKDDHALKRQAREGALVFSLSEDQKRIEKIENAGQGASQNFIRDG
jgi:hypothetical protein